MENLTNWKEDPRFIQADSIARNIIGVKAMESTVMIIGIDNMVSCIEYDSVIYNFELKDVPNGFMMCVDYRSGEPMLCSEATHNEINTMIIILDQITNCELINTETDVQEIDSFKPFLELKAANGCKFYKIGQPGNMSFFPIFAGFPKMNSGDRLNLYSYSTIDQSIVINRMEVYKKKFNRPINIYYRALNLDLEDSRYGNTSSY